MKFFESTPEMKRMMVLIFRRFSACFHRKHIFKWCCCVGGQKIGSFPLLGKLNYFRVAFNFNGSLQKLFLCTLLRSVTQLLALPHPCLHSLFIYKSLQNNFYERTKILKDYITKLLASLALLIACKKILLRFASFRSGKTYEIILYNLIFWCINIFALDLIIFCFE